jgi:hypothetical protein
MVKLSLFVFALFIASNTIAQTKKSVWLFSAGINYRDAPIDVENIPMGPIPHGNSGFFGRHFFKTASIQTGINRQLKKNWLIALTLHGRYNHSQFLRLPGEGDADTQHLGQKKSFKFDFFLEVEKGLPVKKNKRRYLIASAGGGLVNLNTGYNMTLQGTTPSGTNYEKHFQGTFLRLAPKIGIGYQYESFKLTFDAIVIEGEQLIELTALWLGATLHYEFEIKKRKR